MQVNKATEKAQRLKKRNQKIRKRFYELTTKFHYSLEYSLQLLEEEYLPLTKDTIWLIVSKTGYYKNK